MVDMKKMNEKLDGVHAKLHDFKSQSSIVGITQGDSLLEVQRRIATSGVAHKEPSQQDEANVPISDLFLSSHYEALCCFRETQTPIQAWEERNKQVLSALSSLTR